MLLTIIASISMITVDYCKHTMSTKLFRRRNALSIEYLDHYPSRLYVDVSKGPFKKYVTVISRFLTPPPPLSPFVTVCLDPLPPCHHPNSDKVFDLKLAEKYLGLCLTKA